MKKYYYIYIFVAIMFILGSLTQFLLLSRISKDSSKSTSDVLIEYNTYRLFVKIVILAIIFGVYIIYNPEK
jgi:hypothetical protein